MLYNQMYHLTFSKNMFQRVRCPCSVLQESTKKREAAPVDSKCILILMKRVSKYNVCMRFDLKCSFDICKLYNCIQ